MASFLANNMPGRWAELFRLQVAGSNIICIPIQSSGIASDATLKTYTTLAQVFAGTSLEATFTNYSRKVLSSADITVSFNTPTTGKTTVDLVTDPAWTAAGGALNNTFAKLLFCYRLVSSDPDSSILPVFWHDHSGSTNGTTYTAQVAGTGLCVSA